MHIINYEKLAEMFLGKTDKVDLLVASLKKRIPEWLEEAESAMASQDPDTIRRVCHRIRGAAGTITAERLEAAAIEWGDIIKENRTDEITAGYEALVDTIKELDQFINSR